MRVHCRAGASLALLLCSLLPLPLVAGKAIVPVSLDWPPGTQVEALDSMLWHGHVLQVQVLLIPLSVAEVVEAVAVQLEQPLRLSVVGRELHLAPRQGAAWVLALRAEGLHTRGVLSGLKAGAAVAHAPSWLPPGMQRRFDLVDGAGARQAIDVHPGWGVQALAQLVETRLRGEGWQRDSLLLAGPGRWQRGTEQLLTVFVETPDGAALYTQLQSGLQRQGGRP